MTDITELHKPDNVLPISMSVKELLSSDTKYLIPMYQRNYAWGEAEISQLINDINDSKNSNRPYYIGTLVGYQRANDTLEVIDGQQRFTTLTLLALALRNHESVEVTHLLPWYQACTLDFECRPKSTHTLQNLFKSKNSDATKNINDIDNIDADNIGQSTSLLHGYNLLTTAISRLQKDKKLEEFCTYLFDKVQILQVILPDSTDLNHYFEAMNNRGEQLEKHEVLKAKLAAKLHEGSSEKREEYKKTFLKVWDAVANMDQYSQYGFSPAERHLLFGSDWELLQVSNFDELTEKLSQNQPKNEESDLHNISSILACNITKPSSHGERNNSEKEEERHRFSSIINFPNFLLHVLKLSTNKEISLDDKNLIPLFEELILKSKNPSESIKKFCFDLLKIKFLLDHYVIKRDHSTSNEGHWAIQKLHYYQKNSQSFLNTFGHTSRNLILLQSAMHVSTPTQSYKYWLLGVLHILFNKKNINEKDYLNDLESLVRSFVYGRYLVNQKQAAEYYQLINDGTYLPIDSIKSYLSYNQLQHNLIFNYLDYLIWCDALKNFETDPVISQFEFSFRSSVEHFYPQTPIEGNDKLEKTTLHSFGNLCLLSQSKNSKLSNLLPGGKKDHFMPDIKKNNVDSLKVYRMIQLLNEDGFWGIDQINKHEDQMIELFLKDSKQGM